MRVVALTGISGVGKSFAAKKLSLLTPITHLSASSVILKEKHIGNEISSAKEHLRLGNLDENQQLLVAGMKRAVSGSYQTVLLDCHVVIHGKNGLQKLPAQVFEHCKVEAFIFVQDTPEKIRDRREEDKENRTRPLLSAEALAEHQKVALDHCSAICFELKIPLLVLSHSTIRHAVNFLGN